MFNEKSKSIAGAEVFVGDEVKGHLFAPGNYVGTTNATGVVMAEVTFGWHRIGAKKPAAVLMKVIITFQNSRLMM